MATGSPATEMAVLTSTASAPISIAFAASLGAPMPASTTTGTEASSMMMLRKSSVRSPMLVPMGAASGITVAAPASASRLHITGSAWQ